MIGKVFQVLDTFTPEQPELGVREIARRLQLAPSTVGRILVELSKAQVVVQNPQTQRYSLSARVLRWARASQQLNSLRQMSLSILQALNQSTGETATLSILQGKNRLVLERVESPYAMRYVINPGDILPLHSGASGKIFLAFMDQKQREEILSDTGLPSFTDNTITDRQKLEEELRKIRQQGYAISIGERVRDTASVAAPVFNTRGEVVASISISGPLTRLNVQQLELYKDKVIQACRELSQVMSDFSDTNTIHEKL